MCLYEQIVTRTYIQALHIETSLATFSNSVLAQITLPASLWQEVSNASWRDKQAGMVEWGRQVWGNVSHMTIV
jgi:hypothetical protein